jgi:glucose/mannose-6-phosphate isomerase
MEGHPSERNLMRDAILQFGTQLTDGAAAAAGVVVLPHRRIISTGMGGSAIAGEILSLVAPETVVHWDYGLPLNATDEDLVVCTSWSGDTEETISSWEAARAMGLDTLVITSGGRLTALARDAGTPLILLPQPANVPRAYVGYMAGALLGALGLGDRIPTDLDPAAVEQSGATLAEKLGDRMLALYASYPWRKLTGFWKMAYSETTKRQVMANWFPSGAHVEVVGWEGPYQDFVAPVLFRDPADDARYAKNFDALLAILTKKGYAVHTVMLEGNTVLEKVFRNYLLSLWTSYHAAVRLGVDPRATALLDEFKRLKANN